MSVKVVREHEGGAIKRDTSVVQGTAISRGFFKVLLLCLLVGKLWQFLRWDAPLIYHFAGSDWSLFMKAFSCTIFGLTIIAVMMDKRQELAVFLRNLLWVSATILAVNAFLSFVYKDYQFPQLIELSIQWSLPLWYWLFRKEGDIPTERLIGWAKLAISLTFMGHGLYALGIPVLPENFVNMTTSILGVNADAARQFLFVAGCLDMVVVVGIWIPAVVRICLLYAAFWGLVTAMARTVANVDLVEVMAWLDRWLAEMLYRVPHGGLPLWIWWEVYRKNRK